MISFTIPGEPTGKGRPRVVHTGTQTRAFTPEKTAAYEALVKLEYQRQCGDAYIADGPVEVSICAFYGVPASASRRKREQMTIGEIRPTKKPDCDNVLKIVCDALNGLAYRDDAQIVAADVEKHYAVIPRVEVAIWPLKESERTC